MPYVVSSGRLEYRSTISRKGHGRRKAGQPDRRVVADGAFHLTKGPRAVPAQGEGFSLVIVPAGPAATGTHPPRIYAAVARAGGPGGDGTPTVSAYTVPYGKGPLGKQPRAVRRLYGKGARRAHLAGAAL